MPESGDVTKITLVGRVAQGIGAICPQTGVENRRQQKVRPAGRTVVWKRTV